MYDSESPLIEGQFSFDEISIRHGFIRKVYAILSVQLLVTLGFIALFVFVDDIRLYVEDQPWMFIVAMILTFVLLIALVCFESMRRQMPTIFILLGLFTFCESFLLGVISSQYDTKIVLVAITVTAIVAISLTIFASQIFSAVTCTSEHSQQTVREESLNFQNSKKKIGLKLYDFLE